MSRKKARLISCNDKRYVQYYNLYRNKSIILNSYLNRMQTNINTKEQHFKSQKNSEKYKIIIKGLANRNSKKYRYMIFNVYPLYKRKHLTLNSINNTFFLNNRKNLNIKNKVYKKNEILNMFLMEFTKINLKFNNIFFKTCRNSRYTYKHRRFRYLSPKLKLYTE